jgi:hypothetical protein
MFFNLEPKAAEAAAKMVKEADAKNDENVITKALMVLSEQGLSAFGLFLATRKTKDQESAQRIHDAITEVLEKAELAPTENTDSMSNYYQNLTQQRENEHETESAALQRILLTKDIAEKVLIYGRYHAKAHIVDSNAQIAEPEKSAKPVEATTTNIAVAFDKASTEKKIIRGTIKEK